MKGAVKKMMESPKDGIYIAGPMTGIENYNYEAFHAAEKLLRENFDNVINPANHGVVDGAEHSDYLRCDIKLLADCGSIYMLKGWQDSRGARIEYAIAVALDMVIYEQETD